MPSKSEDVMLKLLNYENKNLLDKFSIKYLELGKLWRKKTYCDRKYSKNSNK